MSQSSRTRLLTAGVLIAVFGTGVLVGLVVDAELGASPMPAASEVVRTADAEADAEAAPAEEERSRRTYIYEQVGPNEVQLARIDSIVTEHRARRRALNEDFETRHEQESRAILLETRAAIKAVLSPEQAAEYQRLLDEYDREQAEEEAAAEGGDSND